MQDDAFPITLSPEALAALKAVAGPDGWSADPDRLAPKLKEWRDRWRGTTPLLLSPRTTAEVSALVRCCAEHRIALTPQGGNTGLVGGQIPQGEVLLSLERMNAIREVAPLDDVIVVEAGVVLTTVQEAAREANRFFPLSLAAEGSATVGGLVSTNAGGTAVLRYGTMRDLVLGIEAVLPDGSVFNGLKRLRKDNTGYDLKQLLIGGEGTLGVVTAASLKLFPILSSRSVAIVGLNRSEDAIALLARAKGESGGAVEAFELISRRGVELAIRNIPDVRDPLAEPYPWIVLIEIASSEGGHAEAAMERLLASALEDDLIADAALAQNQAQAKAMWRLREEQSAAQKPEGVTWKHDVSVPVSRVPEFLARATAAAEALAPGSRVVAFGHVGDGNIHYDVLQPLGGDGAAHAALRDQGSKAIHDIVDALGGSISAEHGLGVMKSGEARRYKDPHTVELMQRLRAAFDPHRIMNPRVLF
ncbi:FAD-binding oxidoreductase [Caulobacter sp. S45]|uniref:FAD-binding oxidoreductase n=1 Tax=Caulobacter sp. S45 TaxID=1641861 RepID=UPI00131E874E|nr:FAD-binding oxidoreductase [Caulobacter sp. S45]